MYIYIYIYTYIEPQGLGRRGKQSRRKGGRSSAPRRGRHSTIAFPPNASVQRQPDGMTIHTKKWLRGARFLGHFKPRTFQP